MAEVTTKINVEFNNEALKVLAEIIQVQQEMNDRITALEKQYQERSTKESNLELSFLEKQKFIIDNQIAMLEALKRVN